jgi:hypothetical protein
MKVLGYGRCSTAELASNGVSIEVQHRAVERVAEANGCCADRVRIRSRVKKILSTAAFVKEKALARVERWPVRIRLSGWPIANDGWRGLHMHSIVNYVSLD